MPIDRPSTRGYVLLPLVGTSPPPRGAGPRKALHNGGRAKRSPLPAAVEATTRMTYRQSASWRRRRRSAGSSPKRLCVSGRAENESTSSRRADSAADGLMMSGRACSTRRGLPGLRRATAHRRSGGQSRALLVVSIESADACDLYIPTAPETTGRPLPQRAEDGTIERDFRKCGEEKFAEGSM
jgi:hypothetical protein